MSEEGVGQNNSVRGMRKTLTEREERGWMAYVCLQPCARVSICWFVSAWIELDVYCSHQTRLTTTLLSNLSISHQQVLVGQQRTQAVQAAVEADVGALYQLPPGVIVFLLLFVLWIFDGVVRCLLCAL